FPACLCLWFPELLRDFLLRHLRVSFEPAGCSRGFSRFFPRSAVLSEAVSAAQIRSSLNGSTLEFDSFRKTFHRQYGGSGDEFKRRLLSFQEAAVRHTHLNSFSTEPQSATYGINQFSDLSQEEFRDIYLQAIGVRAPPFSGLPTEGLPARFDWRDKAVVAPVQDQLACSSCWAFSVVGAVQSARAVGGSPLQQLSVQQLLDCSFTNKGCGGGSPTAALSWLQQTREKLVSAGDYPYQAEARICRFFSQTHHGVAVKNFTVHNFRGQEPAMMAQLVERGPLVAVVDAVSWQDYLGGIIQHHCSSQWPNHAVLVVGYDTSGMSSRSKAHQKMGVFTSASLVSDSYMFSNQPAIEAPYWLNTPDPGNQQQIRQDFWTTSRMTALEAQSLSPLFYVKEMSGEGSRVNVDVERQKKERIQEIALFDL
uniref:Cathepsin O n=1 Tax=Oryzias melastigma TaxID=30732 RepID=A0A3B3DMS7_ORYME